jgi:winged helix DNA-binding protein
MPRARPLSDDAVRRLRTAAQHLHKPRRRSAVQLVRHLTGVQAQVLSAAGLALRARTDGLTAERVNRARLRDRSIILTWAMRGTLHFIAAEDYGWLVPLVIEPRMAHAYRRLKQEGVPSDQSDRAVRLIERVLERDGPLPRADIAERLRFHGIRTEGQAIAHLVWLAAARGVICHGPNRGREQRFVLVRDWLGEPAPMERGRALVRLATRYLKAHGPAVPADLVFWSGIRLGDARVGWRGIEDKLVETQTARGTNWMLRSQGRTAPSGVVRLLPSFDEYLLGWEQRDFAVPAQQWTKINRGGGWLHPVVLSDGRAVGRWGMDRTPSATRVDIHPFSRLGPAVRRGAISETKELASFLGIPVEVEFHDASGDSSSG